MQVNEFVKRLRACKIHMLIIGHIREQMPMMFGKDKKQAKMLAHLPDIFVQVSQSLAESVRAHML
jgi:EH domain-containing protein 1